LKAGVMQEQHIATFIRATLSGLLYLHSNNKIHRDIKSSNILVGADGNVKLADFGVSARIGDTMSKRNTFVGTPYWMAPEVIRQSGYNCSADIWSLGITAMELAEGHPPRSNIHPMKVLFQIPRDPPPELDETKCKYSRDFKDFINQCLKKDPEERPSAKDLLRHRFIKNAARTNILIELVERFHFYEANNQNSDEEDNVSQDSHHDRGNDATVTSWSYDTVQATIKQRPTIEPVVDDEAEFEWDDATIKKGSMVVNHDKRSPLMGVQVARDMMAMESVDSLQMLQPILSKMIAKESDAAIRLTLAELMHGFEKLDRQSPRALGEIVDTIRRPPQPSTPTTQTTKDAHGSNSVSQFLLSRWRKTSATPYGDE
ncbi:STE/STE20/YSK protein kinase, partial [Sphaeroforma arctica JP610]